MQRFVLIIAIAIAPTLVSNCAFVPSYKQDLYDQLTDVQSQLSKIQVAVSISKTPPSYEKIEPYFVAALADLNQAKTTTAAVADYSSGHLNSKPAAGVAKLVVDCSNAIESDRAYYLANAPTNEDDNLKSVKDTCSVPKQVIDFMKK